MYSFNYPIVHFWLHHTVHCVEKIVFVRLRLHQQMGQGEVGGMAARLGCNSTIVGTG